MEKEKMKKYLKFIGGIVLWLILLVKVSGDMALDHIIGKKKKKDTSSSAGTFRGEL